LERLSLEKAKAFLSASIELDPLILSLIRKLNGYPEFFGDRLPAPLTIIQDAYETWRGDDPDTPKRVGDATKLLKRYKGVSKDMARYINLLTEEARLISDGTSLLSNWREEIQRYSESASSPSSEAQEIRATLESLLGVRLDGSVNSVADVENAADADSRPGGGATVAYSEDCPCSSDRHDE
jgi:hypothetical protein